MTSGAWTMMLVTWAVITFFTVKFFVMVLVKPDPPDAASKNPPE